MAVKLLMLLTASAMLSACTYADKRFVSDQSPEVLRANAQAVNDAERAERREYRKENREEMMDAADAIHRANEGHNSYYIIR